MSKTNQTDKAPARPWRVTSNQRKFKPTEWKRLKIVQQPTDTTGTIKTDGLTNWLWVSSGLFVVANEVLQ